MCGAEWSNGVFQKRYFLLSNSKNALGCKNMENGQNFIDSKGIEWNSWEHKNHPEWSEKVLDGHYSCHMSYG
jgi:hypothetical protein